MLDLALALDAPGPQARRLADGVRAAILGGRLAAGARLPGARSLARQLGVVRNTVAEAYDILASEGYVTARRGSGTYVARGLPDDLGRVSPAPLPAPRPARAPRPTSSLVRRLVEAELPPPRVRRSPLRYDLRPGILPAGLFPYREWRALFRSVLDEGYVGPAYGEPGEDGALRQQIAAYLGRARGVRCRPEQVVVTVGSQQAFDLAGRLVLEPGDTFAIEEPAYSGARFALTVAGGRPLPIPVDEEGIDVAALEAASAEPPVRLVYVTPSHQYPTGASLSLRRRLALVAWAAERGAWIVEDDYDSEFRYAGRPLPALQGLDPEDRTIYVGTFSKVLHAGIRVGYAVMPPDLVEPALRLKWAMDRHVPSLTQQVLTAFLADGGFERHLRRLRRVYHRRQEALATALRAGLDGRAEVETADAGLQLLVRLGADEGEEARVLARAAEREVAAYPLAAFHVRRPAPTGLVLGYAALPEADLVEAAARLVEAVGSAAPSSRRLGAAAGEPT